MLLSEECIFVPCLKTGGLSFTPSIRPISTARRWRRILEPRGYRSEADLDSNINQLRHNLLAPLQHE